MDTLRGEAVEGGGFDHLLSVEAHIRPAQVVGDDDDHVRTLGGCTRQGGADEEARAGLRYSLAIFLIAAEKYGYFRAHEGYSANEGDQWMRWFPEYDRPLGPPSGPAVREGFLYRRTFQYADVYLDIGRRQGRIIWK